VVARRQERVQVRDGTTCQVTISILFQIARSRGGVMGKVLNHIREAVGSNPTMCPTNEFFRNEELSTIHTKCSDGEGKHCEKTCTSRFYMCTLNALYSLYYVSTNVQ
jgi:hypothetical protein